MSGRRIDLSATQVVASMLAAVTGAIAASTLGVAGTVIGSALMSVAGTAVATVYNHYLGRSRERLRAAADAARNGPLGGAGKTAESARLARLATGHHDGGPDAWGPDAGSPDAELTLVFPTAALRQSRRHDADRGDDPAGLSALAELSTPAAAEATGVAGADRSAGAGGGDSGRCYRWRRAMALVGVALGVFLVAMGTITAFEAASGKPLSSIVGGKHGSGTTVGNLVGGQSTRPDGRRGVHPATSPSGPAPTARPTPTPRASTSPAPSPSPSPTSATTPSPTPSPTARASGPPAPSPHGSAGQ